MSEPLKPCPFCGGPGELDPQRSRGTATACCLSLSCPVNPQTEVCISVSDATRKWNTRKEAK